jgi:hypothetical protein
MKYRRRIYYSTAQRAEIWDRWQRGESMSSIGRWFDRQSSSVFSVISPTGGIHGKHAGPLRLPSSTLMVCKQTTAVQRNTSMASTTPVADTRY